MNTKICSKCGQEQELTCFHRDKHQIDGFQCRCKECSKVIAKEYYYKNKEKQQENKKKYREKVGKEYFAERSLINKYGITLKDRNAMLVSQNHKCDICGVDEINASKGKLVVDHDHLSGKVRSLLCHNCNTLIGHCKESEDTLLKAIQYLRKHKDTI